MARAREWISDCWARETGRRALWAPVFFAGGAAAYFELSFEPSLFRAAAPFGAVLALIAGAALWRKDRAGGAADAGVRFFALAALALATFGFLYAKIRTELVQAPRIEAQTGPIDVSGRLLSIERLGARGARYLIAPDFIEGVYPPEHPHRIRITWRGETGVERPGDRVTFRAVLRPPPGPIAPGAFDYARQAYFEKLGAVGFSFGPPRVRPMAKKGLSAAFSARIETIRTRIADRIRAAAPGDSGAIAAALVTGKRRAISEDAQSALRDAGLAHLLAISGLHMGLAAGLVFVVVRFILALIPNAALRYPVKKWAAAAALIAAIAYLFLSGASWPTRRAFIMVSLALTAILFDRRALSMRTVAVAALAILLVSPEAVLHSGFQMSFSAVVALIATYEWMTRTKKVFQPGNAFFRKLRIYFIGLTVTSLVAGFATGPFASYHFNRTAPYGLAGNLLGMPLLGSVVAPAALFAGALAPLGLDEHGWRLMAAGISAILAVAEEVQSWPGSVAVIKSAPPLALVCGVLGGLWLCLWRSAWRWLGFGGLAAGALVAAAADRPDILIDRRAVNVAIRLPEGQLAAYSARRARFDAEHWLRRDGDPSSVGEAAHRWREAAACAEAACFLDAAGGLRVAVLEPLRIATPARGANETTSADRAATQSDPESPPSSPSPRADDAICEKADLIIALNGTNDGWRMQQIPDCQKYVLSADDAVCLGARALWLGDDGFRMRATATARGDRPWARRPPDAACQARTGSSGAGAQ
ncbi:MAG: ComEC/Rec2 family competence protein [Parvularculaceae bacterium]